MKAETLTEMAADVCKNIGRVYTTQNVAQMWGLSEQTVRRLFADEDGVFTMGSPNPRSKRGYTTIRIPEAVLLRVWKARGGQAA
jgi:hypothetical protein